MVAGAKGAHAEQMEMPTGKGRADNKQLDVQPCSQQPLWEEHRGISRSAELCQASGVAPGTRASKPEVFVGFPVFSH